MAPASTTAAASSSSTHHHHQQQQQQQQQQKNNNKNNNNNNNNSESMEEELLMQQHHQQQLEQHYNRINSPFQMQEEPNDEVMDHVEESKEEVGSSSPCSNGSNNNNNNNNNKVDKQLIMDMLEQHGSPQDEFGQYKAIEQIMLDSERDICIFAGALELLNTQHREAKNGSSCSVCAREYRNENELRNSLEQIEAKIKETEANREESNILRIYSSAKGTLVNFTDAAECSGKKFESRVAFNMRSGSLTELRNQKAECLSDQRCWACLRGLNGPEFSAYLQRIDRDAYLRDSSLHVHF